MNTSQSRISALRASNTKKKINLGKGRFESILDQRKTNLDQQKEKLEQAKLKLKEDQKSLDEEMQKLQEQQDLIQEIGADIKGINSATSILSEDFNCSALRHQMTVLQKTEADLTQQLRIAQQQLDEKTYRLRVSSRNKEDPETIRLLENELKEKAIQFKMIRELLETLKSEILTRENDVILLEFQALQHKKELDKNNQEKEMLIQRRKDAAINKRNIIHEIKKYDQIKLDYSEKKKNLETKLASIQNEQDNLNSFEKELNDKENELKQKQEQLSEMQNELNQIRLKKAQEGIDKKEGLESQKMIDLLDDSHPIDPQSEENVNMEIELDTEEKLVRMRSNNIEIEASAQNEAFNEKRQKLINDINLLQSLLSKSEKDEETEAKIAQAREENSKLKDEIREQEAEIEKINSQLLSEEEMKKFNIEYKNEMKNLFAQEREIKLNFLSLKEDERDLQDDEEEIEIRRKNLENERYLIEKHDKACQKLLDIAETQLEQVKKKYQIAYLNNSQREKKK